MNYKYFFFAAALMALPATAQETYENAKIADEDLNGTARYVGMGGAMEALGADISTISSNPAGIGLMRHSQVSISGGLVSQSGAESWANGSKTHASFDQAGFVLNLGKGMKNNFNVAFNYHKSKNFDFILAATNNISGGSQNKLTYEKLRNSTIYYDNNGTLNGPVNSLDYLYANNWNYDEEQQQYVYDEANAFSMNREHSGYIGAYDINLSGNVGSQFYWGVTFGIKDVHYKHESNYDEQLDPDNYLLGNYDYREITGSGFDVKAGVIVRPVAESPFRIGAYIHTPTFYDLTTSNYTYLIDNDGITTSASNDSYDFKLYTPWKFGLSLGHTVGNYLAIGATYEYADYGSLDTRVNDGGYYDDWCGTYYETSSSDKVMNNHTKNTLKGVSTVKLGLEFKPITQLAIRLGYNYVSPKYQEYGKKDGTLSSYGSYYASQTDYTNWKSTNRFTFGLGYTIKKFTIDMAYQFSAQTGDFYPYMGYEDNATPKSTEVKNNRNQLLLTLGYHF